MGSAYDESAAPEPCLSSAEPPAGFQVPEELPAGTAQQTSFIFLPLSANSLILWSCSHPQA